MHKTKENIVLNRIQWNSIFLVTFLSAYFYYFSEWVFIITKPSFLYAISFLEKLRVMIFTSSVVAGISFFALAVLFFVSFLTHSKNAKIFFMAVGTLLPTAIISSLCLLIIDNFTYTVFTFGIATTISKLRVIYTILFIALFVYAYYEIFRLQTWLSLKINNSRLNKSMIPLLAAWLLILILTTYKPSNIRGVNFSSINQLESKNLPNIILITADGLNAAHTSVYGYERDTTPRISELAKSSLVAENAFTNSGNTAGSLISIYTSKFPTTVRVLYPPDILKGEDSFQHLPGILHQLGYYSAQFTFPYYADAYSLNLLSGFDYANGNFPKQNILITKLNEYLQTDEAYFIYETSNRIFDRLRHIFFIKNMDNQLGLIQGTAKEFNDQEKIDHLLTLLYQMDQPVFAHIHWMGTHGPNFHTLVQNFSKGKDPETQERWDDDFYDDSILDFDQGVGRIIDELNKTGMIENTIIIIGSDHGQSYVSTKKIPLIMHFPNNKDHQYIGVIQSNTQNIDIAPTILGYLGIDQPEWMEGKSLLEGEPGNRPIFALGITNVKEEDSFIFKSSRAPFYQFGYISVIHCDKWYRLRLDNFEWSSSYVADTTVSCMLKNDVSEKEIFGWMIERLKKDGFDTSKLSDFSIVINNN